MKRARLLAAVAGGLAVFGFLAWLFAQTGSWGLFAYGTVRPVVVAVFAAACLPLALAGAAAAAAALGRRRAAGIAAWAGAAAGLACAALAAYLFAAYALPALRPLPAWTAPGPLLVDPAAGINPRPRSPGGPSLRIAVSSDPHVEADTADNDATRRILAYVGSGDYDAFFDLGDDCERGMFPEGWAKARAMLTALGGVPARPLMGNHDALLGGEAHYRQTFFPPGMASDSGSPFYYAVDAGPVRVLVLNLLWGSQEFDARQRAWLLKAFAETPPDRQIVVMSHCYFYSSGYIDPQTGVDWSDHPETIRDLTPLFERAKVSLVLSGHNHYMEYLRHAGVAYAVVGAMGGLPDPPATIISKASVWRRADDFGLVDIAAWPDRLELSFVASDGTVLFSDRLPNPRSAAAAAP